MKDFEKFRKLLDEQYSWPAAYSFKFIVPQQNADQLFAVFASSPDIKTRESRQGNYISVTATMIMPSCDHVVAVYEAVSGIKGLIAL